MGRLSEYINKKFGIKTVPRINPETNTVSTTVVKILKNNPDRIGFLIFNLGDYTLYLAPNNGVSANYGILISSGGGFLNMIADEDFELVGYNFYAVSPGGETKIFVMELIAE